MKIFNQQRDVPYADSFNIEEEWLILSKENSPDNCILRASLHNNIHKSTIFKGKIESNSIASGKENYGIWTAWA